jgi:hypothetical protein
MFDQSSQGWPRRNALMLEYAFRDHRHEYAAGRLIELSRFSNH